jgi:hypothetical protein
MPATKIVKIKEIKRLETSQSIYSFKLNILELKNCRIENVEKRSINKLIK